MTRSPDVTCKLGYWLAHIHDITKGTREEVLVRCQFMASQLYLSHITVPHVRENAESKVNVSNDALLTFGHLSTEIDCLAPRLKSSFHLGWNIGAAVAASDTPREDGCRAEIVRAHLGVAGSVCEELIKVENSPMRKESLYVLSKAISNVRDDVVTISSVASERLYRLACNETSVGESGLISINLKRKLAALRVLLFVLSFSLGVAAFVQLSPLLAQLVEWLPVESPFQEGLKAFSAIGYAVYLFKFSVAFASLVERKLLRLSAVSTLARLLAPSAKAETTQHVQSSPQIEER